MLRIYVSSTFEDLKEERRSARDAIQALGHHAVGMEDYVASDELPVERCMKDVRSCHAYIGIFAWKYGFRPDKGEKSITHLEYEAAKDANIPCYLFLLPDDAPWPPTRMPHEDHDRIRAFRDMLRLERMVGWFRDSASLASAVTKSLAASVVNVSQTPPIPDMLPYLCDRSLQKDDLIDCLGELEQKPDHPLLCIIHGDETEAHDKFLERLQKIMLPALLPRRSMETAIRLYRLEWPANVRAVPDIHRRLTVSLSEEVLGYARGSREDINRRLAQNLGPVVIHAHLISENWQHQKATVLDAFVDFWQQWPELTIGQQLFIFLFIKYQINKNKPRQYRQANSEILNTMKNFDFARFSRLTGKVISQLQGPMLSETQDWARGEEAGKFCDRQALVSAVSQYYQEWESQQKSIVRPIRIPTDEIIPKLRELISRTQISVERIL